MHTPSHHSSIRATAATRRYAAEFVKVRDLKALQAALIATVVVVQPKVAESEEASEPITVDQVLSGEVKARIRVGPKFGSVKGVNDLLAFYDGEMAGHREVMADCKANLKRLIGSGNAEKSIRRATRNA
jgi:hypothetical protein